MNSIGHREALTELSQELRKNATRQERHLWYDFLAAYPVRFRRQVPIDTYIADFYCHAARLVIELDGSQHYSAEGKAYDSVRTAVLEKYGLMVLRFSNADINKHFLGVCEKIRQTVTERTAGQEKRDWES